MDPTIADHPKTNVSGKFCFIDGNFLLKAIENLGQIIGYPETEARDITAALPDEIFRYYWYDSLPKRKYNESEEEFKKAFESKKRFLNYVGRIERLVVRDGFSKYHKSRGQQQKAVDVLLAVDALQHSFNGSMTECHLMTGDLDFLPVVDALVMNGVRVVIQKIQFFGKASEALLMSSDASATLKSDDLSKVFGPNYQFTSRVIQSAGFEIINEKIEENFFKSKTTDMYFLIGDEQKGVMYRCVSCKSLDVLRRLSKHEIIDTLI